MSRLHRTPTCVTVYRSLTGVKPPQQHVAILVENHRIFPLPQYFCSLPRRKGFPWNWVPVLEIKNANDGAFGPKRSLTITSTYMTDGWTDIRTNGHGTTAKTTLTQRFAVKTASNSVNVLLHRLNNTHLITYCSAQLTRTLNCKTPSLVYWL